MVEKAGTVITRPGNLFLPGDSDEFADAYPPDEDLRDIFSDVEDDSDTVYDEVFTSGERGTGERQPKQNKSKGTSGGHVLNHEAQTWLNAANAAYVEHHYEEAIKLLEMVISIDGNAKSAYQLLSAIYEDLEDFPRMLAAKITAMHLDKKNQQGWTEVAYLSRDAGQLDQAIQFFQYSSTLGPLSPLQLSDWADLYEQTGQYQKAVDLFTRLRKLFPDNPKYLHQIAIMLSEQGRISEAIALYENLLHENQDPMVDREGRQPFGFSELNILAELYLKERSWMKVIVEVKRISRWLFDRSDEEWWDELKDDSEYDDRRWKVKKFEKSASANSAEKYQLPIDIRMNLLYARLKIDDIEEALVHLKFLQELPVEGYSDLYLTAGIALQEAGLFEEALSLYTAYEGTLGPEADIQLWLNIAKCEFELRRVSKAEQYYTTILNYEEDNMEALVALAEIYGSTDRTDDAKALIEEVNKMRERVRNGEEPRSSGAEFNGENLTMFILKKPRKSSQRKTSRLTQQEKQDAERRAEELVERKYRQLQHFKDGLENGNPVAVSEWLRIASELVDMFTSIKKFYPSDRNRVFTGLIVARKRKGKMNIDERIAMLSSRLKNNAWSGSPDGDDGGISQSLDKFRSLSFDQWLDIFMLYALSLCRYEDIEDAYSVINSAKGANVFYLNPQRMEIISRVHFACTFRARDFKTGNEIVRQYINGHQFFNDAFRLYGTLLPSGLKASEMYNGTNVQKYILRQIKAMDSLLQKIEIAGAARVVQQLELEQEDPVLLVLYSHIMLLGRSYVPSLNYLNRAVAIAPKDTMILLTLGIVHVHRAIQRLTTNRHLQIIQGFSYLLQYYSIRSEQGPSEAQEADYNMGRTFHLLGLPSLAACYYQRVLDGPKIKSSKYDLKPEAAYNLHLIYTLSGNLRLAKSIVDTNIVI